MRLTTDALTRSQQHALERGIGERAPGPWILTHALWGDLDLDRLRAAVASLAQRTTLFARSYVRSGRSWQMLVGSDVAPSLSVFDLRSQPEEAALGVLDAVATRGFIPEAPPLAQFCLIRRNDHDLLVFTAASWLIDSFSMGLLCQALSEAYAGQPSSACIDIDQAATVEEEQSFLASTAAAAARRYWLSLLGERRTQVAPAAWSEPSGQKRTELILEPSRLASASEVATELGLLMPQLLRYALHLTLARMTGSEAVITSMVRRPGLNMERSLKLDLPVGHLEVGGYFLSLPMRELRLRDYLLDSKRLQDHNLLHARLPGAELRSLMKQIEPGFSGFTNVAAQLDNIPYGALKLPGVEVQVLPEFSRRLAGSDVTFTLARRSTASLTLAVRNPAIMASMRRWLDTFSYRLERLGDDIDSEIGALAWMGPDQRAVMIDLAHGAEASSPTPSFLDRFLDQVEAHPEAEAVRDEQACLSYRELLAAADALAERLQPLIQGKRDPLVGLCLPRGIGLIVSILGILRAGAGYVPLDPANPAERLLYILADAKVSAVIADDQTCQPLLAGAPLTVVTLPTEAQWRPRLVTAVSRSPVDEAGTAYVIYTSGTTGLPKGVVIEQRHLAAFLAGTDQMCATHQGDRWLQFASINFDASVLEIANCLARGATLVVASSATRVDPEAVAELLRDEHITHAFIPPAMLRALPRVSLPSLSDIYMGGETSDEQTVAYWSRAVRLWNVYGPTETTVICSAQRIAEQRSASDLGGPLPGYTMHLLDEQMQPVPFGAVGEIWIGGEAVSRGYLGRPELTAQKFVPNPFGSGRLYRSGDLARHLPNGSLEYLGRNDFQVKIRGFRIELADIETAIAGVAGVTGVHVSAIDTPSGKALAAWFTADREGPSAAEVAAAIARQLPHYMVPPHLVRLEALPTNISGKVDRTRLPMPGADDPSGQSGLSARELQVRDIWAEILHVDPDSLGSTSHFFHLGGHSLSAALACHAMARKLAVAVSPRLLFEHPVLSEFCTQLESDALGTSLEPVQMRGTRKAPLLGALPTMMLSRHAQLGADTAYTIVMRVDLEASVQPTLLHQALTDLLADDPVFSSFITEHSGSAQLNVDPQTAIVVSKHHSNALDVDVEAIAQEFRRTAFDLSQSPLWRAALIEADTGSSILFAVHHAIFDGWSLNLLLEDLAARYDALLADAAFVRQQPTALDYGLWHQRHPGVRQQAIDYWQAKLKGASCRVELPTATGVSRPLANRELALQLSPQVADSLRDWSSSLNITLPPVLFAAYLIWLWRITGQRELSVAYPYAGRDVPGSERIFGMFVQMGFLRISLDPNDTLETLATHVGRQMIEDREHLIASPYDADLSACGAPNLLFSHQSGIGLETTYGSLRFAAHEYASTSSKADIACILYDTADGGIAGRIEYDGSALNPDVIPPFVESLQTIINAVAGDPHRSVAQLPYLPDAQRTALEALSLGPAVAAGASTLVEVWRATAASHPDAIAIVDATRAWSYRDVEAHSDRLACHMITNCGVRPQDRIGLSGSKSVELIMGALAILKCGAAYVPLDPRYPSDRLSYILKDAELQQVVADQAAIEALKATDVNHLAFIDPYRDYPPSDLTLPTVDRRHLAYVIYTSGSTGRPKGVLIEHASVPPLLRAAAERLGFDASSRMLLLGTLNFDASVLQVFLPFSMAGSLVVPPADAESDLESLHRFIAEQRVTHLVSTPSLIRNLPKRPLPDLRLMGFGGETIDAATADYWSRTTALWSLYGPTETTIACSGGRILPGGNHQTIGTPLAGYSLQLVNELLQPVPLGAVGEILIGGGAARGYLGRPELTLERFVPDPSGSHPYGTHYRSGDLGRFLADGSIEFLGRNDDQIKLRGFRIELGEIETALLQADGVVQAAVAVRGEGDLRMLVAYITGSPDLDCEAVRLSLTSRLPSFMVPSRLVRIDALPLNTNGKLDRKALPDLTHRSNSAPPRPGLEQKVAAIWEELLRIQGIGRDDDFFSNGGNSLLVARLQVLLRERLGLELSVAELYAAPTVAALAGQRSDSRTSEAQRTACAGISLTAPVAPRLPRSQRPSVLLTGASGFLGIYLLRDVLASAGQVTCLMRGHDHQQAREVLITQARAAGLVLDLERVDIVLGDLAADNLGLQPEVAKALADDIEVIVHCGAWVHHLYSYTTLRASNVDATASLLRLALTGARRASFCFVSTESAAAELTGTHEVAEAVLDPHAHPSTSTTGYVLSKWVAEQLVAAAVRDHGLDAVIARPGNITGDSTSGFSNYATNHFWLFTKGCLQLGLVPDLPNGVEMTPVDSLSRAIAALAFAAPQGLQVTNLGNPDSQSWAAFLSQVAGLLGRRVAVVDTPTWQAALAAAGDDNALAALRTLYAGDLQNAAPTVQRERSQEILAALGVPTSIDLDALTALYVRRLNKAGFWST